MNTANNKNYMSIAVSVLTTSRVARNNGGAARQENRPQSATFYIATVVFYAKRDHATNASANLAHLQAPNHMLVLRLAKSCFLANAPALLTV